MNDILIFLLGFVCALLGWFVGKHNAEIKAAGDLKAEKVRAEGEMSAALVEAEVRHEGRLEEAKGQHKDELQTVFGRHKENFEQKHKQLIYDLSEEKRKSGEYFGKIDETLNECEIWRSLYHRQAVGHDNAQGLMMKQIEALVFAYRKETGKMPKLQPIIEKVRVEWNEEHGAEARKERGLQDGTPNVG